ncbi:hypothetical protein FACS189459_3540 [Bacilli bacterium]|nr:hypothetical protein FACS189459_3540 [Bacilli bacterium]
MDYTNNLVKFANKLADESGKICRKYFNSYIEVNSKGDIPSNTVTNADIEVEKLIRSMINKFYPGHSIIGEELNNKNTNSEYK